MKNLILKSWMMTFLIVMCCGLGAFAQVLRIEGFVNDELGEPLPRVTVLVKGTLIGTETDENGKFVILAPPGATLVFSFKGYVTQEKVVTGLNGKTIILKEEELIENRSFLSESKIIIWKESVFLPRKENDVA